MAKKSTGKSGADKSKGGMSAMDHRKVASELHARARLHDAKADLADAKDPPKRPKYPGRGYPC